MKNKKFLTKKNTIVALMLASVLMLTVGLALVWQQGASAQAYSPAAEYIVSADSAEAFAAQENTSGQGIAVGNGNALMIQGFPIVLPDKPVVSVFISGDGFTLLSEFPAAVTGPITFTAPVEGEFLGGLLPFWGTAQISFATQFGMTTFTLLMEFAHSVSGFNAFVNIEFIHPPAPVIEGTATGVNNLLIIQSNAFSTPNQPIIGVTISAPGFIMEAQFAPVTPNTVNFINFIANVGGELLGGLLPFWGIAQLTFNTQGGVTTFTLVKQFNGSLHGYYTPVVIDFIYL